MKHLTSESASPFFSDGHHRYSPNPCGISVAKGAAPTMSPTEQNAVQNPGCKETVLQTEETLYLQPKASAPDVYLDLTENYLSTQTGDVKLAFIQRASSVLVINIDKA
jgi:hypothetical protein